MSSSTSVPGYEPPFGWKVVRTLDRVTGDRDELHWTRWGARRSAQRINDRRTAPMYRAVTFHDCTVARWAFWRQRWAVRIYQNVLDLDL